jgi:hypothetical protein
MNPVYYEQIMSLLGLIALWVFWYYLWKPLRVTALREKLFALRDDLFDLAADGVISFNDPAYTQLRLLINGMIRFAHRVSFLTMIVASIGSRNAPSNTYEAWLKSVQRLPQESRSRLLAIHRGVFESLAKQIFGGAPLLWFYVGTRVVFSTGRALLFLVIGKNTLESFTVDRARIKVDIEETKVAQAGAKAIVARVLFEEQKRTSSESKHAYAQ